MPTAEKDKLLMTVFKKYAEYEESAKKLLRKLKSISNDLSDFEEHVNAEQILSELE